MLSHLPLSASPLCGVYCQERRCMKKQTNRTNKHASSGVLMDGAVKSPVRSLLLKTTDLWTDSGDQVFVFTLMIQILLHSFCQLLTVEALYKCDAVWLVWQPASPWTQSKNFSFHRAGKALCAYLRPDSNQIMCAHVMSCCSSCWGPVSSPDDARYTLLSCTLDYHFGWLTVFKPVTETFWLFELVYCYLSMSTFVLLCCF